MNRKYVGMLCLLCLAVSAGCAGKAMVLNAPPPPQISQYAVRDMAAVPLAANPAIKDGIDAKQIQGDIQNIFYAGGSEALIDADQLYLYDLQNNKVLAKTPNENFVQPRYQACSNGYATIGDIRQPMNGKIVFYDGSLKKVSELTYAQITGSDNLLFSDSFAVSPDGKKIAYADNHGVFVFNTATKSRSCILSLDNNSPAAASYDLMHIAQLSFTGDSKAIVFLSGVNNGTGHSVPACGKINVDGTGLVNKTISGFTPYEIAGCYEKLAFFGEDDRYSSGKILSFDITSGSSQLLPLSTKQERAAFGSDNGAYYATGALSESGCTVRVYETATGSRVYEQSIPHGGNPLYVARNPVIRVWDKTKTCIVLMGNRQDDLDTKVISFQF